MQWAYIFNRTTTLCAARRATSVAGTPGRTGPLDQAADPAFHRVGAVPVIACLLLAVIVPLSIYSDRSDKTAVPQSDVQAVAGHWTAEAAGLWSAYRHGRAVLLRPPSRAPLPALPAPPGSRRGRPDRSRRPGPLTVAGYHPAEVSRQPPGSNAASGHARPDSNCTPASGKQSSDPELGLAVGRTTGRDRIVHGAGRLVCCPAGPRCSVAPAWPPERPIR
jgi:hypothetical protein